MPLTDPQIKQRLPLWKALSDLWLDTELEGYDYAYIARTINESPFTLEEAFTIHKYEVAPAVFINLMSVAGEWAMFDEEWLKKRCLASANKRGRMLNRLMCAALSPFIKYHTDHHCQEIRKCYVTLKADLN
ncbi:DUF7079 family protein [Alkalimarinus alittae]|uniref:DUF7079 domain-containing protein n=1 Tax=Alkalimarinus alittae TaxID=2961619 RepID=A0ABY6MY82_9ALTE|nr:hypothetical protein [Alkalimarinus alittae]UZE94778.1 hypothetical protein NKI27_11885 [Alkalimarinus alittae]